MKNRLIPVLAAGAGVVAFLMASNPAFAAPDGAALAQTHACMACHSVDKKVLGPAYKDVAKKYKGMPDAVAKISKSIKDGSSGVWGPIPMPANGPKVSDADIKTLAEWILASS